MNGRNNRIWGRCYFLPYCTKDADSHQSLATIHGTNESSIGMTFTKTQRGLFCCKRSLRGLIPIPRESRQSATISTEVEQPCRHVVSPVVISLSCQTSSQMWVTVLFLRGRYSVRLFLARNFCTSLIAGLTYSSCYIHSEHCLLFCVDLLRFLESSPYFFRTFV